jgi:hypothetical protein
MQAHIVVDFNVFNYNTSYFLSRLTEGFNAIAMIGDFLNILVSHVIDQQTKRITASITYGFSHPIHYRFPEEFLFVILRI